MQEKSVREGLPADKYEKPLLRVLEGHADLLRESSEFPDLGKLPALASPEELKVLATHPSAGPSAVVAVVVAVAVAARPGAMTSDEFLKAKLLDIYSPVERDALKDAVTAVRENPELVKAALGMDETALGKDFRDRLRKVELALE